MDNQILCYGVHTNFRLNRRKAFKGHNVSIIVTIYGLLLFIVLTMLLFISLFYRLLVIHAKLPSHLMQGTSLIIGTLEE